MDQLWTHSFFPGYVCAREHMLQEGLVKDWITCCAKRKLKFCRNNLKQLERSRNAFLGFLSQELMQRDTERNKEWKRPGLDHASTTKMMRSSHPRGDCIHVFQCIVHSTLVSWPFTTVLHVLSEVFSRWRSSGRISWCISSTLQAWCHEGRC